MGVGPADQDCLLTFLYLRDIIAGEVHDFPKGRKTMALGFSPLTLNKSEGGEIMTDFEIISVVIMVASLVLKAIQFGRGLNKKK